MFRGLKCGIMVKTEKSQVIVYTGIWDTANILMTNVFMSIKRSPHADIKNAVIEMIANFFMKPG